ncbi:hypothetical protein EV127DRAFT_423403 [Xylaria flabelliformis]|nr:hypothetical protein EV127DRAFT_423403 [Xylaria flabelliformis]
MSFLRQFARVSIFNSVLNKAYPSIGLSRNLRLTIIPPSIRTMAKERAVVKEPSRERKKKTSSDKVSKKGKSKKHTETRDDTADDKSTGGVSVNLEPVEDTSMVDSLDPEDAKSSVNKKSKNETKSKEDEQDEVEADKGTTQGGAEFFSIDTNPTPVDLAAVKVAGAEDSKPEKLNRQARRRILLIEKKREDFRKKIKKGSGEDSVDEALLQEQVDKWIHKWDLRAKDREEKKKLRGRMAVAAYKQKQMKKEREKFNSLKTELSKMDEW